LQTTKKVAQPQTIVLAAFLPLYRNGGPVPFARNWEIEDSDRLSAAPLIMPQQIADLQDMHSLEFDENRNDCRQNRSGILL